MRALADPDAWPETDLVLRRRLAARGGDPESWRPWRAYGALHLWNDAGEVDRTLSAQLDDGGDRMTGTTAPLQATEMQTPVGTLAIVVDDGAVVGVRVHLARGPAGPPCPAT